MRLGDGDGHRHHGQEVASPDRDARGGRAGLSSGDERGEVSRDVRAVLGRDRAIARGDREVVSGDLTVARGGGEIVRRESQIRRGVSQS